MDVLQRLRLGLRHVAVQLLGVQLLRLWLGYSIAIKVVFRARLLSCWTSSQVSTHTTPCSCPFLSLALRGAAVVIPGAEPHQYPRLQEQPHPGENPGQHSKQNFSTIRTSLSSSCNFNSKHASSSSSCNRELALVSDIYIRTSPPHATHHPSHSYYTDSAHSSSSTTQTQYHQSSTASPPPQ